MLKYIILFLLLISTSVKASEVALFGSACTDIKEDEKRSNAVSRATDKASFDAISQVNEFIKIKNSFQEHEFNELIYEAIDNNISDLIIKTKKSDNQEVCVEVTGYLNIHSLNLPEVQAPESIIPTDIITSQKTIYIAPTYYYNNTQSKAVSKIIEKNFNNNDGFLLVEELDLADYIIYPKVLKAKVDNINSSTNRFHMVISLEAQDKNAKEISKEHQNKFILLEATDDEQEKAKELMQKLFKAASVSILTKLETIEKNNQTSGLLKAN